ncbi:MAG: type II secretion system protein [bacterium]|nr:type II secretion system protein [bacterium]
MIYIKGIALERDLAADGKIYLDIEMKNNNPKLTGFTPTPKFGVSLQGKRGFTLIELLVVISIIGFLTTTAVVMLDSARKKARDARRLADFKQIQTALGLYYDTYNRFPDSDFAGCGGWDASGNGTGFIHPLITEKLLGKDIIDPITNYDCGNYRYYRYSVGDYGCDASKGAYYVLGINDLETSGNPAPSSPGWRCPSRNWQGEFDWVTGGFER